LKVLFIIKKLHNASGGAERVLAYVSGGLASRGHDVKILSFDARDEESFYSLHPSVTQMRSHIGDPVHPTTLSEFFRRVFEIRKLVRADKPDCVIAFMHSSFIPAILALIGTGIPVIASEHIVPEHYRKRPVEFLFLIICSFFSSAMTVVSAGVKTLYPSIIANKLHVIRNPVSCEMFGIERNSVQKIILNVGRLEVQKDQRLLIDSFSLITKEFPDWRLRIVGDGTLRPNLNKQIQALNLQDRIFLVGALKDISCEYAAADIFVLSSRYESFGMATAEAMASGLPVIGFFDCPGTNELVRNGTTGILVRPHTSEYLAEAMRKMILDPSLRNRMGLAGRETLGPHELEAVVFSWEELIVSSIKPSHRS
jgi:glycosyltransferase involved in cell wall biosynthesis